MNAIRLIMLLVATLSCTGLHTKSNQHDPFNDRATLQTPSSPLQAKAVQSFIHFLGGVRNATPQSSEAKVKALREFNELYTHGNIEIQELLAEFVTKLRTIMKQKVLAPRRKERRAVLLMEETKHMLNSMQKDAVKDGYHSTASAADFVEHLYTALNPTFGDYIRWVTRVTTITIGSVVCIYFILILWRITGLLKNIDDGKGLFGEMIPLFREIQNGKGTLGELFTESSYVLRSGRETAEKAVREGKEPPPSLAREMAEFLKKANTSIKVQDQAAFEKLPIGAQFLAAATAMLVDGVRKTETFKLEHPDEEPPPGTAAMIAQALHNLNEQIIAPQDQELTEKNTYLQLIGRSIGQLIENINVQDYKDRNIPREQRPIGTGAKFATALHVGATTPVGQKLSPEDSALVAVARGLAQVLESKEEFASVFTGILQANLRANTWTNKLFAAARNTPPAQMGDLVEQMLKQRANHSA